MNEVHEGDVVEVYSQKFELQKVSNASFNERYITVFKECSDEELETVQDHFTIQVVDIDEVTVLEHGLSPSKIVERLLEITEETFNG